MATSGYDTRRTSAKRKRRPTCTPRRRLPAWAAATTEVGIVSARCGIEEGEGQPIARRLFPCCGPWAPPGPAWRYGARCDPPARRPLSLLIILPRLPSRREPRHRRRPPAATAPWPFVHSANPLEDAARSPAAGRAGGRTDTQTGRQTDRTTAGARSANGAEPRKGERSHERSGIRTRDRASTVPAGVAQ